MANNSTATTSAASNVLNTFELLEAIILQLPSKDVLLLQRVSKTWRSIIARNKTLQKALFFVPSQEPLADRSPRPPSDATQGPIFDPGLYAQVWARSSSAQDFIIDSSTKETRLSQFVNPLLPLLFPHSTPEVWAQSGIGIEYDRTRTLLPRGVDVVPSWRKMYLTQPPATEVRIFRVSRMTKTRIILHGYSDSSSSFDPSMIKYTSMYLACVTNKSSVTIADFVDFVEKRIKLKRGRSHLLNIFPL